MNQCMTNVLNSDSVVVGVTQTFYVGTRIFISQSLSFASKPKQSSEWIYRPEAYGISHDCLNWLSLN